MNTYPDTYVQHIDRLNHESEMHITKLDADYTILSNSNTIDTIQNLLKLSYFQALIMQPLA